MFGTRLLLISVLAGAATAAANSTPPEVVLERMRQAQTGVTSMKARIEQVKSYPQLGIEDPAEEGWFYMARVRGGSTQVKMEIQKPEVRVLSVSNGTYLLYQPRIKQAVEGKLAEGGKKGLFSGLLTGSSEAIEELDRDYDSESLGESTYSDSELNVVHLRFVARAGVDVYCQQIELWIDTSSWLPVQQTCQEANQSLITFKLEDIELNVPLKKDLFEVELPADVERLRG